MNALPVNADVIIQEALEWVGTPYRHQASVKGQGTDCLGLIRGVWRRAYRTEPELLPPYTPRWDDSGQETLLSAAERHFISVTEENIQPADVLIFRMLRNAPAKHCGILISDDRFIHAYAGRDVVASWFSSCWRARIAGAFRFPGIQQGNIS